MGRKESNQTNKTVLDQDQKTYFRICSESLNFLQRSSADDISGLQQERKKEGLTMHICHNYNDVLKGLILSLPPKKPGLKTLLYM